LINIVFLTISQSTTKSSRVNGGDHIIFLQQKYKINKAKLYR
jgi:hypothetical protein